MDENKKSGFSWLWMIILIIVLLVVLWFLGKNLGFLGATSTGSSAYQAIFLSNDQVYFGKITKSSGDYATLTDIYYLQVAQALQPSEPSSKVNLVKLGDEMYGPADIMEINRDHILFIEDLKPESQVVKAIEQYKASKIAQPAN